MSINTTTNEKDYTKLFPFKTLTTVVGKPTYEAIAQSQREIYACAHSVRSVQGGGNHGELGLTMSPTAYALVAPSQPYFRPAHP